MRPTSIALPPPSSSVYYSYLFAKFLQIFPLSPPVFEILNNLDRRAIFCKINLREFFLNAPVRRGGDVSPLKYLNSDSLRLSPLIF